VINTTACGPISFDAATSTLRVAALAGGAGLSRSGFFGSRRIIRPHGTTKRCTQRLPSVRWARSRDAGPGDGWPIPEPERDALAVGWALGLPSDPFRSPSPRSLTRVRI